MKDEFDVIVIGGGPAGENVVGRCADGGLEVALVEHELVGGECSYWGCIPSKTLIRPGDAIAAARRVPGAAGAGSRVNAPWRWKLPMVPPTRSGRSKPSCSRRARAR